ncbi:MAG: Rieske (2Fe-2S) protein [bacterium]|nr:Rieske (2Fe-2S) protein [bacterium]
MVTRTPVRVATLDELPLGGQKMVNLEGQSIGLYNVDGEIIAVLNVCPHELAPICRGRVTGTTLPSQPGEYRWGREGEILSYAWHGWEFDLTTGNALADSRKRLRRYPVTIQSDIIYVTP